MKPLEGMRVLDLSHVIAGPMASYYLAQMGAEVIKIEPPGGEVMRGNLEGGATPSGVPLGFGALNAGKRSLVVDIREESGARAVRELAAGADVFIENFRPGAMERHGLDYEAIRAQRPDIVYCSISGYGQRGEWSQRGAYDHVVQALTGMMMLGGEGPEAPPLKVGFPVIDVGVGMVSALAIVSALMRRLRTGEGQRIDASMVQASTMLMYPMVCALLSTGRAPERVGNRGFSRSPSADTYRCRDGWLATAANTPRQFRALTSLLGLEALCNDPQALDLEAFNRANGGFVVARDLERVRAALREAFAVRSAAGMETALNAAGVPAARVRTLHEFVGEVRDGSKLTFEEFAFDEGALRTCGLGFAVDRDGGPSAAGAPVLDGASSATPTAACAPSTARSA